MKKRIEKLVVMALIGLAMFSCSKDDGIVDLPVTPPTPEPEEPVDPPKDVLFGINPVIASIQPVTRGIITSFTDNDRIGLFLTDGELGANYQGKEEAANVPAVYLQGTWKVDKDIVLTEEGTAFAYYPYNDKVTDGAAVPLEIGSQTDYLYATPAAVDEKNPIAQIGMKHALALVSVRIRKNDYQHEGRLTKIEVLDVQTAGTMNIATGEVTKTGPVDTYMTERNLMLDDEELVKTQMIMLPTAIAEAPGNIRFQITVDDKYYIWDVPKSHNWEAGKEYTYTLNLSKIPEELPDLELDVDYWTKYGKDDNIQIEDHTQPGSAYYRVVDVEMGSTPYGRTVVQDETYIFTGVVNDRKNGFKGRVKYTLWQGDKMVEQFPSYYFESYYYNTLTIPCFITATPGTYRLKMLLKPEGSNTWILPSERYSAEQDWIFTVQRENNMPSLKSMNVEGFGASTTLIRSVKLNTPFNMEFALTNRAQVAVKGEIKAVWHRTFTGEFFNQSANDGNTWEDEIGRMSIDIPSTTEVYKGKLSCTVSTYRANVKKWVPSVSFYYRAEGSNTWQLMRSDADSELQRWKGADEDKRLNANSEGEANGWWCLGGINYQDLTLEE